ncbi:hypothetical protein CEXT_284841 [Caerostris extrusa]|uniref:Uncharacterized protein n=1 Tax=Caerostris extrusa TaxID=172846 RepID=A0AAV4WFX3_CAEEX|nr:hypothetical protein CEXT_284841 [Caerostris extrusa]
MEHIQCPSISTKDIEGTEAAFTATLKPYFGSYSLTNTSNDSAWDDTNKDSITMMVPGDGSHLLLYLCKGKRLDIFSLFYRS